MMDANTLRIGLASVAKNSFAMINIPRTIVTVTDALWLLMLVLS